MLIIKHDTSFYANNGGNVVFIKGSFDAYTHIYIYLS